MCMEHGESVRRAWRESVRGAWREREGCMESDPAAHSAS
jgi:hypothetical protein